MTRLEPAPDFTEIDANSGSFRDALFTAISILTSLETKFGTYSRHSHRQVPVSEDQVIFEEVDRNSDEPKLLLYPLDEVAATQRGLPSTWAFAPGADGSAEVVVLRYAERALHDAADIDVASDNFRAMLQAIGDAFVAAGIHTMLELNVTAGYLFAAPEGHVTCEDMVSSELQTLRFIKTPDHILTGDWHLAACWMANAEQVPAVMGVCNAPQHWPSGDTEGVEIDPSTGQPK